MEKTEFNNACYEVLEILKSIKEEDLEKIPKEEIQLLKEHANYNHEFKYDVKKRIKDQPVSKLTKGIIATYFYKYTALPKQKEKIRLKQEYDLRKNEEAKKEKYNYKNMFNNEARIKNNIIKEDIQVQMVEYKKEKWYTKLLNKIKNLF